MIFLIVGLLQAPTIAMDKPASKKTVIKKPVIKETMKKSVYTPTQSYIVHHLRQWKIMVHPMLEKDNPELFKQAYTELDYQLYQVIRRVPAAAVKKLRSVTIWLEYNDKHHPAAVYHPDVGWLKSNGMNPDKAKCVELSNANNFVNWSKAQPFVVLHELSHAYHNQFVPDGFHNREVIKVHEAAMKSKIYDKVLHINGNRKPHYAKTNHKEYFAESSEAYFGTNDFYPFVNSELKDHDPKMHTLLKKLWDGNNEKNKK